MTRVGAFDPAHEGAGSSLFVYAESPVTSAKLNLWNGNIAAGFELAHHALRALIDDQGGPWLLSGSSEQPFLVSAQVTPDLTVRVRPGLAVFGDGLVGLFEEETYPPIGAFTLPAAHPRIDALGISSAGEWVVAVGEESATPVAPDLAEGDLRLADIYLRVGSTSIKDADDSVNGYLIDRRPNRRPSLAHRHAVEQPAESPDGSRTEFTTSSPFVAGSLRVFVNGLALIPGVHFEESESADGYEFDSAPPTGAVIHHEFIPG